MADALDNAIRASKFNKKSKQRRVDDSPEAREARIQLYMGRVCENPAEDTCVRRLGGNGRPINLFTGVEYTEEEMKVVEIEEEEEE